MPNRVSIERELAEQLRALAWKTGYASLSTDLMAALASEEPTPTPEQWREIAKTRKPPDEYYSKAHDGPCPIASEEPTAGELLEWLDKTREAGVTRLEYGCEVLGGPKVWACETFAVSVDRHIEVIGDTPIDALRAAYAKAKETTP